jgi:hypothetical protein
MPRPMPRSVPSWRPDGGSKGNVVELFRSGHLLMGARRVLKDDPAMLWGAPEAARLFLLLEKLIPPGPIFQHCKVCCLPRVPHTLV